MVSPSNKRKLTREKPSANKESSKSLNVKLPYKPLLNKRFYLDVNNYKGIENLKKEVNYLGGVVDDFIVKEVNYVITNRCLNPPSKGSSSETTQQPSPNTPISSSTPQPQSSIQSTSFDSSCNLDSPKEDKKRVCTRAEVLLERACLKKQGTSDVLENARLWAIPVWSLSKLLKWLSGLKESPLYRPPRNLSHSYKKKSGALISSKHTSHSHSTSSLKVQKLHEPFIKVEGFERNYKPQFKELSKWPILNLDCAQGVSPFADHTIKEERKFPSNHRDIYPERQRTVVNKTRGSYCELCSINYSDLRLHLQSESHLAFVKDKNNYARLDELISDYDLKQMRYSKCMQAGKQLANLKTIVHTHLSKQLVYELGETLYSGPPSTKKEAKGKHVSPPVLPSTGGFAAEEPAAVWLTGQKQDLAPKDPLHFGVPTLLPPENPCFDEVLLLPVSSEDDHHESLSEGSEADPLVLQDHSYGVDGASIKERTFPHTCLPITPRNVNRNPPAAVPPVVREKGPTPSHRASNPGICEINSAMVRLIQEPKAKTDSHVLRRAARPKRGSSVDGIDSSVSRTSKQSQKELRNRRVSCCPSERSDSEASFDPAEDALKGITAVRRPKNGEAPAEEHSLGVSLGGGKLNGEVSTTHAVGCAVNGITSSKPVKARRVSRTNSDDSDGASWSSPKANGVVDITDNDRVDINLLLEISAKDRKRFENKKAKIKRKCADWMLITETERYYNEKEEILRNKSREEEEDEDDDDGEEELEEESESDDSGGSVGGGGGRSSRRATSDRRKPTEDDQVERSRSSSKKDPLARKTSPKVKKKESHRDEDGSISSRKMRGRPRGTRNAKDLLSISEEETIFFESDGSSRATKGKGKDLSDKEKDAKPRKRLSDAERFLRDNREYYQFPETRDRLRRNTSYGTKEQHEELSAFEEEKEEAEAAADTDVFSQSALIDSVCSFDMVSKNRKGKSRRVSGKETKENSGESGEQPDVIKIQPQSLQIPTASRKEVQSPPPRVLNETLDSLYFSFEGAPVQETWYQTYQRFIDGSESNEFVYPQEALQFILPYEMPKEYFRDLHAKKTLLAKRKSELSDLVRKSPRCHASTLALFSNIFPTKKKKKSQSSSLARTEEISSDGTSTPVQETPSGKSSLGSDVFETEEELLFIGQCMEQIMKSALEESLSSPSSSYAENTSIREPRKSSSSSKRRVKGKRGSAPPRGPDKMEIPLESKAFDNPLASEIDSQFLFGLPRYLEEVSIVPEDTLCKDSVDLLSESFQCECTERTSCDEASSVDERTEVSSESLSLCDSETVDSFNSNFSVRVRKSGPPFKKRRKNLTGWPTRKKRRPVASASAASTLSFDDNDNSSLGFDDHEMTTVTKKAASRARAKTRRPFAELLEPCSDLNLDAVGHDRRASPRKRSSVLYIDTWPLRFRHHHK